MKLLLALRFLTTIPLPWGREASPEDVGRSLGYFPVVGIIIGLILTGLNWLFGLFLPSAVVNILLIVSMVVISGGLHLDGFIDTCDGIGKHKTPEERWRVMQDSRVGSFGVVGGVLLLLVKYISLNSLPESLLMITLVFIPVLSRWAMVYAVSVYSYAKPSGLGNVFKQGASWQKLTIATFVALVVAVVLFPTLFPLIQLRGLAVMFGVWVITVVMAAYLKRKFSGLTGDTYGAINEVAEVVVLIMILLLA